MIRKIGNLRKMQKFEKLSVYFTKWKREGRNLDFYEDFGQNMMIFDLQICGNMPQ